MADRDSGASLIELLVAIVLLGTLVIAVITAVRTTVVATTIERDRAKALQWLQSASQVLQGASVEERLNCLDTTDLGSVYEQRVREETEAPFGWVEPQIIVKDPVLLWGTDGFNSGQCQHELGYSLQLVEIEVWSPDNRIIKSVQVVVDGR